MHEADLDVGARIEMALDLASRIVCRSAFDEDQLGRRAEAWDALDDRGNMALLVSARAEEP